MTNEPTQEVRFAVVLYGGVSLAIYINGVVQELLSLVRSTSGLQNLKGSEPVYQNLGRLLGPGFIPKEQLGANDPINTKFKIDIISGTSAGGINGIYLAKALATESDLSQLQELWFNEGGIDGLLNDRASYAGLPVRPQPAPQSLLNSRRMYCKLLDAFDKMVGGAPSCDRHASPMKSTYIRRPQISRACRCQSGYWITSFTNGASATFFTFVSSQASATTSSPTTIHTTLGEIESRIQQTPDLYEPDPYAPGASLKEITFKNETCFSACYQMRASDVTDQFATILARALWIDEDSILFVALRSLIRAWREWRYEVDPRQPTPNPAVGGSTVKDYLTRFDLPYRIRRLRFVLRKLDTLYGLQLEPDHPAYEEAVSTRAFGLCRSRESEPPKVPATDLTEVRLPLSRECAKLQRTLSRLLELHNPPDTDTPNQPASPDNDPQSIVLKALPDNARDLLIPVLLDIAGVSQPEGQENQPLPDNKREPLTTEPLNRSARESRLTDLACDRRAAKRLANGPMLRDNLDSVAQRKMKCLMI